MFNAYSIPSITRNWKWDKTTIKFDIWEMERETYYLPSFYLFNEQVIKIHSLYKPD